MPGKPMDLERINHMVEQNSENQARFSPWLLQNKSGNIMEYDRQTFPWFTCKFRKPTWNNGSLSF